MTESTHREMVNFIWDICNILRGPYKRNEYWKAIFPILTRGIWEEVRMGKKLFSLVSINYC
jgi:hypothetical protein